MTATAEAESAPSVPLKPSWLRWPPNCCETCSGPWKRTGEWEGTCYNGDSVNWGDKTEARFRCQDFKRRDGV